MTLRLITGLLGGLLFIWLMVSGYQTALIACALAQGAMLWEYSQVQLRQAAWQSVATVLGGTIVLVLLAQAFAKARPAEDALLVLIALMLLAALFELLAYERGKPVGRGWLLLRAVACIMLPLSCLPALAQWPGGFPYPLLVIGASWAADTAAIFVGKLVGRTPLVPRTSPKKTVEGLFGGLLAAGATWVGAGLLYPQIPFPDLLTSLADRPAYLVTLLLLGMAVATLGVLGDLTFSLFKRQLGTKDYSHLLPGHGGFLDRFDSLLFVAPAVYLLCLI